MRSRRKSGKKQNSVFLIALSMVLFIIMCSACFGTIQLQRTYAEKSEINAKLKKAYEEKTERGEKLKKLRKHLKDTKAELEKNQSV